MPGRVSSIPVFQRRAAGAQALEQSPQRRPLSADQAPRKKSDPSEVGRGRSGTGVQSTRPLVQRPQSDSRLVAPYPALPRARIEYCVESEAITPRASFRPRSRGRVSGVRDEGSRSPRPPVYRGPRSRPAGPAQPADPTQVSDRSRAVAEHSPTAAPGRGRHRTGHRENVCRNPRGASDPLVFSSTGSSRTCVQKNNPQSARTPSGGARGSPRYHCSGIPTRRISTAEAAAADGSTSSINLSDISGLSVATISPSLSPLSGGTSQTVRPCRNQVDVRRNGSSLPRRSRTRAYDSDPVHCTSPAELMDRRGACDADQRRGVNSRTSLDKIGTDCSKGPPSSKSRRNTSRSSSAMSNVQDEHRPRVKREAESKTLDLGRSSFGYANIRKGLDEVQTETTTMNNYLNRKQELNSCRVVSSPVEHISRISTLKAPVKPKVQRSLSLQSTVRPFTSDTVQNDCFQSSVEVALDGVLQSLPDLQALVDGACDSSTDDSTGCQRNGQLNQADNVHRDKDLFISDSISARNPFSGTSVAVNSYSPSSTPSKHRYLKDDSCESKYNPGRNRQTTTICDLKPHQEDVTLGPSPPSADRFFRTSNYNSMHNDGLALAGSDDRMERRLSVISRTSRGEASGCESSTESCSGSGSVCLSVGSPQRRQSVERSIYSSVIHVNGKEDGYVTTKTRIQRSWQDSAEIQATIQGEKDADENKVRLSLNVDGDFLNDQFDAIIETLKQVATSVQEQDSGRRSSFSATSDRPTHSFDPIYAEIRSPVITCSPIDEPIYSEICSPDPQCSITPKEFTAVATPRAQASHNAFFDSSPTLDQLARRLHADANQLSQDCDYVNFHDLESPYRTTKCVPQSASEIISSAGLQHPTTSASTLFSADRNSYQSSGPHSIDLNNIPYSRNLESVQECSENGSRPDSCEGPSSYEAHLRKQVVKRTLARSLSDKGSCSRPAISLNRCSSECDSDTEKSGSKGVFARLLESERGQRLADSNGSVFSSTTDTGSGRSLETRSHSSDRKRRSRNSTMENCVDARRVKRRDAAPRDWKLRGLDRLMRAGWRTRQSHSMGDEYRDSTITIDDFIASLYAHQGSSVGEAAVLSDSDLKMPSAPSANREHSPAVRSNSANVVPSGGAAAEKLVGLSRVEASSQPSSPVFQRRSVSLPKTFLADRYGLAGIKAAIPSVLFPWRRSTSRSDDGDAPHATDDVTARTKDGVEGPDVAERRRAGGVTKQQRQWKTCSSPLLPDRRDGPGWEGTRTWSTVYDEGDVGSLAGSSRDEIAAGCCVGEEQHPACCGPRSLQADVGASSPLPGASESVLQKFRKSFSLRFQRRTATVPGCGDMDTTTGEEGEDAAAVDEADQLSALPQEAEAGTVAEQLQRPEQDAVAPDDDENGDRPPVGAAGHTSPPIRRQDSSHDESDAEPGLRWAGCAWRSSTDRHRSRLKKESRSIKCGSADSGDSGILVELSASPPPAPRETPGDTEMLTAGLPLQSTESVPSVARERKTDPLDGVHRRGGKTAVRRARSDVGGQLARGYNSSTALRGHKTSCHQPAAIQEHPAAADTADGCGARQQLEESAAGDDRAAVRRGGSRSGSTRLRRSMSEPIITYPSSTTSISSSSLLSRPGRHHRLPPHHQHVAALADDRYQRRRPRRSRGDAVTDDDVISESDDELQVSESDETRRHRSRGGRQRQRRHQERVSPTTLDVPTPAVFAEAHWDYITLDPEELAFRAGDVIQVLDGSDSHWWYGARHGSRGWFLAAFVRLRVSQEETVEEVEAGDVSTARRGAVLVRKQSVSLLSHDQVRAKVVMEIVSSERTFVQDLVHVIEGYLEQVLRRPDLFSEQQVSAVFGNIRALHSFQSDLLQRLEARVDRRRPHESCLGQLFVQSQHGFAIYADYCNNHPAAVAQLQQLYANSRYRHFFEACRLLRAASDISLDGFLLTPIQKICKYPLQLAELLKYTRPGHADHEPVRRAQAAMKAVAVRVNEAKRRMESLEQLASWQMNVEGWMGPDLLDTSSELIHQAEVTKLTSSSWSREVCTLFLFDHLLVYCRRDLLKRSTLQFRGRINLDTAQIIDIADGKDEFSGASVKHAVRVHSPLKNKWYIFCCKTEDDKVRWMLKFREERMRISRDQESGFRVLEKFRDLARSSAENHLNRPKKPKSAWFSFGQNKNQNKKRSRSQAPLAITSRRQSIIAQQ